MVPLHQGKFDIYALALQRGHGFGDRPPIGAWEADNGQAFAIATRHTNDGSIGLIVLRRRVDGVWAVTIDNARQPDLATAMELAEAELHAGRPAPSIPSGVPRRSPLYDPQGRQPSEIFKLLAASTHRNAGWLLNQLYLSLPRPDDNWAADCQTENFHTRLWEAQLLASFREQGLLVTQPVESPDFKIENRQGGVAWVEAVTANPQARYEPVNAKPSRQPELAAELFFGPAALRFAKTIGSKLQRRYADMAHVQGMPFVLALADFHAPASMVWSREALLGYLYGMSAEVIEIDGKRIASSGEASHLLGTSGFSAGLFRNDAHSELSAIIFTNACTLSKFNRVAISASASTHGLRYARYGRFFDRRPDALEGVPFCMDVASDEYRMLWPQNYEPWCAELEVFHNPFAKYPLPEALVPEATHWVQENGEQICRSYYETNILWSRTLILSQSDEMPTYETMPTYLEGLAKRHSEAVD